MNQRVRAAGFILILITLLLSGCVTVDPPGSLAGRFFDTVNRYPAKGERLRVEPLTAASLRSFKGDGAQDVYLIVHPGYALFFRDQKRSNYSDVKFQLLMRQFDNEERFIRDASRSRNIVVLIIPGQYDTEMPAPDTYTAYLNAVTEGSSSVFYLYSESVSNGNIPTSAMVDLYRFLQGLKVKRVLIGGGYIGRCQREFYAELTAYYQNAGSYIVPELSTISPEDVSDADAAALLQGIEGGDQSLIRKFIVKKTDRMPDELFAPR